MWVGCVFNGWFCFGTCMLLNYDVIVQLNANTTLERLERAMVRHGDQSRYPLGLVLFSFGESFFLKPYVRVSNVTLDIVLDFVNKSLDINSWVPS